MSAVTSLREMMRQQRLKAAKKRPRMQQGRCWGCQALPEASVWHTYALHCCATNMSLDSFRHFMAVACRRLMDVRNCFVPVYCPYGVTGSAVTHASYDNAVRCYVPMHVMCTSSCHWCCYLLADVGAYTSWPLPILTALIPVHSLAAPSKSTTTILPPPLRRHEIPCSCIAIATHASLVLKQFTVSAVLACTCLSATDSALCVNPKQKSMKIAVASPLNLFLAFAITNMASVHGSD